MPTFRNPVFVFFSLLSINLPCEKEPKNKLNAYHMRKTLLLVTAGLLAYTGSYAQEREKPEPVASEFSTGQEFYLYNVDTGKFYTEGNAYGTQSSVGDTGLKCRFILYEDTEGGPVVTWTNYSNTKGQWMNTFATGNGLMYVDRAGQADYFWQVAPQGNNIYKLKISAPNPIYNQENYPDAMMGLDLFESPTRTSLSCFLMDAEEPGENIYLTDWCFVTPESYEKFQQETATYKVSTRLKPLLAEAALEDIDVTDEQAVYDNQASTDDELTKAINSVTDKILDKKLVGASTEQPVDVTKYFITNYDYARNDNEGWLGGTPGFNVTADLKAAEFYNVNYDYYQNLTRLPTGYYKVGIQALYRSGSVTDALTHKQEGEEPYMQAEIYAIAGTETVASKIKSIYADAPAEALGISGEIQSGDWYIPDNMAAAAGYFATGRYKDNAVVVHVTDGNLRIGIRKTTLNSGDWIFFDNWSLEYCGTEAPNP